MKYILVYSVDDYPDNGGGTKFEQFENVINLDERVNWVMSEGHNILAVGEMNEYEYKVIETVTKVVRL